MLPVLIDIRFVQQWGNPSLFCLVFDLTNEQSFVNCSHWLERIRAHCRGLHVPGKTPPHWIIKSNTNKLPKCTSSLRLSHIHPDKLLTCTSAASFWVIQGHGRPKKGHWGSYRHHKGRHENGTHNCCVWQMCHKVFVRIISVTCTYLTVWCLVIP